MKVLRFCIRLFLLLIRIALMILLLISDAVLSVVDFFCKIIFWIFVLTAIAGALTGNATGKGFLIMCIEGLMFYMLPWGLTVAVFVIVFLKNAIEQI